MFLGLNYVMDISNTVYIDEDSINVIISILFSNFNLFGSILEVWSAGCEDNTMFKREFDLQLNDMNADSDF